MDPAQHSPEEAKERFSKLPGAIQDLLYSPEMNFTVQQIGHKHQLHIDQIGILSSEAGNVMMGYTAAGNFVTALSHSLNIDEHKAGIIAQDINEQLFSKVREAMGAPLFAKSPDTAPSTPTPTSAPLGPSVVMPSSAAPVAAPTPAPAKTPAPPSMPKPPVPTAPPAPAPTPAPAPAPDLGAAEAMLSEKKVTPPAAAPAQPAPAASPAAKADPAKPQNYKADPYREPVE